ncbi:MAG: hypothetical protein V4439_00885 [Patescibacteria group bacterium]
MDIKELNRTQMIMLALLLSFVTSIATGITTVTLMQQAPSSVTVPINRIVRETVEKVVPADTLNKIPALSTDQQQLLEDLKAIKPLTVSLFLKGMKDDGSDDKILGTGLFLGNDKVVIASVISAPKEGEVYVVKSVLGEQKILKVTAEKDFTIVELVNNDTTVTPDAGKKTDTTTAPAGTTTTPDTTQNTAPAQ